MNVEIKQEQQYPYAGKSDRGNYVVFISRNTGFVIQSNEYSELHFSSTWAEQDFMPLPPGSVTITI